MEPTFTYFWRKLTLHDRIPITNSSSYTKKSITCHDIVIINHNNEYLSAYAHNDVLLVKEGQKVKKGQVIARMGSTDADRVKLHFEIRYKGNSVNPRKYLP